MNLSVFFGEASDAVARVYARVEGASAGLTLSGRVIGPFCEYAHTLPAQVPLADKGAGQGLLAEAVVPDPCFWTPELPFQYRVHVELRRGNEVVETTERWLGIRWFGARGRSLFLKGRRHVVRGVAGEELSASTPSPSGRGQGEVVAEPLRLLLKDYHDLDTALCVNSPSDALCETASRLGVLLVAKVNGDGGAEFERLARWSAVGIAVMAQGTEVRDAMRTAAPNLLFAEHWAPCDPGDLSPRRAASWAQAIVCCAQDLRQFAALVRSCPLPILAQRRLPEPASIGEARVACDRLQADLAPLGDFAGYLV